MVWMNSRLLIIDFIQIGKGAYRWIEVEKSLLFLRLQLQCLKEMEKHSIGNFILILE